MGPPAHTNASESFSQATLHRQSAITVIVPHFHDANTEEPETHDAGSHGEHRPDKLHAQPLGLPQDPADDLSE